MSDPVFVVANDQLADKKPMLHDLEDNVELNIECKSPVLNDSGELVHFIDEVWELRGNPDGIDTEEDYGNMMFEMHTSF